ncbi:MAG: hypothetical protein ACRDRS_22665 [Pseudonocardiaceae bacterium]
MIVDCDRCEVRGGACQDCVITLLLGAPPAGVELDATERQALRTLAEVGMVPQLRLVDRNQARAVPLAATDTAACLGKGAERCSLDDERSRRQVS